MPPGSGFRPGSFWAGFSAFFAYLASSPGPGGAATAYGADAKCAIIYRLALILDYWNFCLFDKKIFE